ITSADEQREAAFIEAIRIGVSRIRQDGQISLGEINKQIEELLENSIRSEGIINLFSDVDTEFSIFDEKFLTGIANMKQKNLAIELMNKLLREEIKLYGKTAVVKAEEFSARMKKIMDKYRKNQIANAESLDEFLKAHHDGEMQKIIDELLEMARDLVQADKQGEELGMTKEELSFYHALTLPETVKSAYEDDMLIKMAIELTEKLKENESIDWQEKQSGRARMRSIVRRLLKKYGYPPAEMKEALQIVLRQCEHWTERRM
ncbi:MAG TPA: DUF3387 domain-containing protein, partial [Epulopiscium sp.]|nr:DUF3387 domain-containing protein [Candidatus Epulonipiscium sp.]